MLQVIIIFITVVEGRQGMKIEAENVFVHFLIFAILNPKLYYKGFKSLDKHEIAQIVVT